MGLVDETKEIFAFNLGCVHVECLKTDIQKRTSVSYFSFERRVEMEVFYSIIMVKVFKVI